MLRVIKHLIMEIAYKRNDFVIITILLIFLGHQQTAILSRNVCCTLNWHILNYEKCVILCGRQPGFIVLLPSLHV